MLRVLTTSDLRAGDVLLSTRMGLVARMIRLLSGSSYSHAAIFDGTNVVELEPCGAGIKRHPPAASCASSPITNVYRHVASGNKRLGKELPFNPIAARIDHFAKSRELHGYSELLLLGVLLATRANDVPEVAFMLRELLDEAHQQLSDDIQHGRRVTLASEFVYTCFFDTQLAEYQLDVAAIDPGVLPDPLDRPSPLMPTASAAHQSVALTAEALSFLRAYLRIKNVRDTKPVLRNAGAERAVPYFVTPGDLAASPNLVLVGALHS